MERLKEDGVETKRITFRNGTKEELTGHTGAPGFRFIFDVKDRPQSHREQYRKPMT